MSLNPAISTPLETDFRPFDAFFSSPDDSNFFDTTTFLDPGYLDSSPTSPVDDLTFSPPSFFADDSGTENDDFQFLLSSYDTEDSCPLGKRKRGFGSCVNHAAEPTLVLPSILDDTPGEEGSSEGVQVKPFELSDDPCILQVGHPMHVCCRGPPGMSDGVVYSTIENCAPV